MKNSIVTAMAVAALVTIMFSGISVAGPKRFYKPSYKPGGLTTGIKRPTRVPNVPQGMQYTLAGAINACNSKYPGLGVNKAVLHPGKGWLCIVGDLAVGWL